jgi:hypothetical protein
VEYILEAMNGWFASKESTVDGKGRWKFSNFLERLAVVVAYLKRVSQDFKSTGRVDRVPVVLIVERFRTTPAIAPAGLPHRPRPPLQCRRRQMSLFLCQLPTISKD